MISENLYNVIENFIVGPYFEPFPEATLLAKYMRKNIERDFENVLCNARIMVTGTMVEKVIE